MIKKMRSHIINQILCISTLLAISNADIFVFQEKPQRIGVDEFQDLPARFGSPIPFDGIKTHLVIADPIDGCSPPKKPPNLIDPIFVDNWFVLIQRYNCTFETKIRNAQIAGYDGAIVYNVNSSDLEPMSAKNPESIFIPSVFVGWDDGEFLKTYAFVQPNASEVYYLVITNDTPFNINTHLLLPFAIIVGICFIVMLICVIVKCIKNRRRLQRYRLPSSSLNKIATCKFAKDDPYDTCAICLEDYLEGEKLRVLPCAHAYHCKCIDPWLTRNKRVCPVCKRKVFAYDERPEPDSDSDSEIGDTSPLINSMSNRSSGGTFRIEEENPFQRARRAFTQLRSATPEPVASQTATQPVASPSQGREAIEQSDSDLVASPSLHSSSSSWRSSSASSIVDDDTQPQRRNVISEISTLVRKAFRSVSNISNQSDGSQPFATSSGQHSINVDAEDYSTASDSSVQPRTNPNSPDLPPVV